MYRPQQQLLPRCCCRGTQTPSSFPDTLIPFRGPMPRPAAVPYLGSMRSGLGGPHQPRYASARPRISVRAQSSGRLENSSDGDTDSPLIELHSEGKSESEQRQQERRQSASTASTREKYDASRDDCSLVGRLAALTNRLIRGVGAICLLVLAIFVVNTRPAMAADRWILSCD